LDITNEAAVKQLYIKIQHKYGRHADILVNNAAVNSAANDGGAVLHEASVDEWWLNFVSYLYLY
jgi:NAD(P)-dependent dehydrogenase (short-subunit alcohol dehydrogenase family)